MTFFFLDILENLEIFKIFMKLKDIKLSIFFIEEMNIEEYYNKERILEVKNWLENFEFRKEKAVLIIGHPGIGKTESVHVLAKTLGMNLVEFNASYYKSKDFIEKLKVISRICDIEPTLILLDEVDGAEITEEFMKVLKETVNPIIMTANDYQILKHLGKKEFVKVVYFYRPKIKEVLKVAKSFSKVLGTKPDYSTLLPDFRSAVSVAYGGSGYSFQSRSDELVEILNGKVEYKPPDKLETMTLVSSAIEHSHGWRLYMNLRLLSLYDLCGIPEVLSMLRTNTAVRDIRYPSLSLKI